MAREFQPTDSKSFFVGRRHELAQITGLLDVGQTPTWLIQLQGDGGIGKTRLLESLHEGVQRGGTKRNWRCTDVIDFHKTANRTPFGLLSEIARQMEPERFPLFTAQLAVFGNILNENPDASLYQDAVHRVANAFFDDWRQLLRREAHVLLLFDTCEEMHDLTSWVMKTMLPQFLKIQEEVQAARSPATAEITEFQPQTIAVWAGRVPLPFAEELNRHLLTIALSPLRLEEVKEFFQKPRWECDELTAEQLEQLNARCGGRPLYVALSYDWLKNGVGTIDDLLNNHAPFEEKLVSWISRLQNRQSEVILMAALAWRRIEPGLLAKLLNISKSEAKTQLETLAQFCFVKYRHPAEGFEGSFQLHDEMRDLVKRHFWAHESNLTLKKRLQEIIDWYKTRIDNAGVLEGKELPKTDERRALLVEYIYYECGHDPNTGSLLAERLFKKSAHYIDLPFCELLNYEVGRFKPELSHARIDQLCFQQALVAFWKEDYNGAGQLWHSLIRRPDCDKKLRASSHMMLVELQCYTGEYNEALEHAKAAEKIYGAFLQKAGPDQEIRELVKKECGQLHHNRGYVYRLQGRLSEALKYYEKALAQGGTEKNTARCLNNIGYVYFLQGDAEKAVTYAGKALQICQQLGIAYELGLCSNTLGMIMEGMGRIGDAANLYLKAHQYFEATGSDRGLALVQINLGRLKRITNAFDEALKYLKAAARVFENKGDTAYLITALNEIGCAFRLRATPEARMQAKEYLHRSLGLSKKIKNYQAIADNLDDLQILFYQWSLDFKNQGQKKQAETHLSQAIKYGQEARKIAKTHGLITILANLERANGDICFELQDYEKAFKHFLNACHLLAQAVAEKKQSPIQIQQRLAENANRLQQKLHMLPLQDEAEYARKILTWMNDYPKATRTQLSVVRNFLRETLHLSHYPLPAPRPSRRE